MLTQERRTTDTLPGRRAARGFSLIEVMISTTLVGLGVVAVLLATQSGTTVNMAGQQSTLAAFLADEIREWTLQMPFEDPDGDEGDVLVVDASDAVAGLDDVNDLRNAVFCPPRNASGAALTGMAGWSQAVSVDWRDPDSIRDTVEPGSSDLVRVTVTVLRNGKAVHAAGWLVARKPI